jgi:hypothetical protein
VKKPVSVESIALDTSGSPLTKHILVEGLATQSNYRSSPEA